ncbi:hypothetical protein ACET3X_002994 [Alternaria dauci]|uniref:Uncharacterized protein n=1 Tax=Alternaria dauci TaxID=48095 RepID=A0ABR3URM2_9PLEO
MEGPTANPSEKKRQAPEKADTRSTKQRDEASVRNQNKDKLYLSMSDPASRISFHFYGYDGKKFPGNVLAGGNISRIRWEYLWGYTTTNETDQRKAIRLLGKWLFLEKKPDLLIICPFDEEDEAAIDKLIGRIRKQHGQNLSFDEVERPYTSEALERTMMETPPFHTQEKANELVKKPVYL